MATGAIVILTAVTIDSAAGIVCSLRTELIGACIFMLALFFVLRTTFLNLNYSEL